MGLIRVAAVVVKVVNVEGPDGLVCLLEERLALGREGALARCTGSGPVVGPRGSGGGSARVHVHVGECVGGEELGCFLLKLGQIMSNYVKLGRIGSNWL